MIYRCRLCGCRFYGDDVPEHPINAVNSSLRDYMLNPNMSSWKRPYLKAHGCKAGGAGVGELLGVSEVVDVRPTVYEELDPLA